MTDEKRIERLTGLARKVWPNKADVHVLAPGVDGCEEWDACVVSDPDGDWAQLLCCDGPCAVDALEAALLVLAGELTCVVEAGHLRGLEERAESAETKLAALRGVCRSLAVTWAMQADASYRHDVGAYCRGHSDELLAALDGEP